MHRISDFDRVMTVYDLIHVNFIDNRKRPQASDFERKSTEAKLGRSRCSMQLERRESVAVLRRPQAAT
jgi:hypothetical protein